MKLYPALVVFTMYIQLLISLVETRDKVILTSQRLVYKYSCNVLCFDESITLTMVIVMVQLCYNCVYMSAML